MTTYWKTELHNDSIEIIEDADGDISIELTPRGKDSGTSVCLTKAEALRLSSLLKLYAGVAK